ncbi:MAG: threonylcarbamoyl-AMP synthase, partial [Bdellovibrionales bacterium]|nr:threonylcarbamoyl-AMP synthase [Bdellovibrionales bacterium]
MDTKTAIQKLNEGDVVALPTETVYGLAGLIDNESAIKKIFSTKERPFFDPLIVHVKDQQSSEDLAQWDSVSKILANEFWPGPLSLVLNKSNKVSELITSGGPTVALRCPSHPLSQEVLKELPCAFAAPSANRFGRTSPTTAQHVIIEFEDQVSVVDGGESDKGIESTIIQVNDTESTVLILRPGMITSDDLQSCLDKHNLSFKVIQRQQNNVPGHLKNHYQPQVSLVLGHGDFKSFD